MKLSECVPCIKGFMLILASLLCVRVGNAQTKSDFSVDTSSANQYLKMAKSSVSGKMPTDSEWESLFASAAYKALLDNIHWDKEEFKNNVRSAFEIVYDPANKEKCDSIALILQDLNDVSNELPFFVSTALSIRDNLDKYTDILASVDMDSIINTANSMALELVPGKGAGLTPQSSPVYFIVWDLECRNLSPGVFLDVNTFFYNGLQAATEALAHEMHHFYLGPVFDSVYADDIKDGAVIALAENMREGVADIINKKSMPLQELVPYGESILRVYNADYLSSPEVLAELDSVTCSYLDGNISEKEYFRKAGNCAHFGGHTTGDFMVFLIRDQLGIDAVVTSVGDLDAFVDNYNEAARKAGTYVFSDRFTDHIHSLSQPRRRK